MRARNFVMVCIAMLALGAAPAQAQGLGGLLKKGKKALEKVSGSLDGSKGNRQRGGSAAVKAYRRRATLWRNAPQPHTANH